MSMSSLNFCVIASEICLTLDNIGCTDITLEAAKAHLQDDELTKVDGEDLAGWADVTLRKHPVLLRITHFMPQFMNLNLQKLIQGCMVPTLANVDLTFDAQAALQVRHWFFSPHTPIAKGFATVIEDDFHRCCGAWRERFQNETLPHLIHFLNVLGRKNKLLIESFMQLVPKDIGAALGQAPTRLTRGASDNRPSPGMRGGAREEEPPVTPVGCSSGGVEPMFVEEEADDEIDLHGDTVLPEGISSSVVLAGPTKKEPVVVHTPARWDSQISYSTSTEQQHSEIEILLASRQIGEGGLGLVLKTEILLSLIHI